LLARVGDNSASDSCAERAKLVSLSHSDPMTNRMTTIVRHEGVNDAGSYEVKFSDGRPPKFFNWDDGPIRRVRPDMLTSEQALQKARAFADAERDKDTR
jgi:hypothetical protein